jgi:hypothetical protein
MEFLFIVWVNSRSSYHVISDFFLNCSQINRNIFIIMYTCKEWNWILDTTLILVQLNLCIFTPLVRSYFKFIIDMILFRRGEVGFSIILTIVKIIFSCRQRGACGDFVNLRPVGSVFLRLSFLKMFIEVGFACMYSYVWVYVCIYKRLNLCYVSQKKAHTPWFSILVNEEIKNHLNCQKKLVTLFWMYIKI